MESLSADTIPAGAAFPGPDATFCCAPCAFAFTVPFAAGFVPAFWVGFDAVFNVCFVAVFCDAGFTAGSGAAASISRRLHSGIWADALQERSRGYSGCLE